MSRHGITLGALLMVLGIGLALASFADEPPASDEARTAKLIEQLDATRFTDRQAAQQELADLGKTALPALEKAAESETREISGRAIEIIQRHFQGDDAALKAAAKESLERMAKSQSESVARRANDLLSPPKPPEPQIPRGLQGLRIGRVGQIQIQVAGGAGPNVKRVSMKEVNGVKEIEAHENSRKVKIVDDPANGIKLEVTETRDGKEETKKYEAKNAEELKTKHPDAHKLYDEYTKAPAGIQVQGIQIGAGGIVPQGPGQLNVRPIRRAKILRPEELDAARENVEEALKELDASLETLRKEVEKNGELKGAVEKTEAAKKRLEELKGKLES
jgi:hypothetical protein